MVCSLVGSEASRLGRNRFDDAGVKGGSSGGKGEIQMVFSNQKETDHLEKTLPIN